MGADPTEIRGRPMPLGIEMTERQVPDGPTGVVTTACLKRKRWATRETPAVRNCESQPELREEQAGPFGVAERLVVVMKPGNAGGAKGP